MQLQVQLGRLNANRVPSHELKRRKDLFYYMFSLAFMRSEKVVSDYMLYIALIYTSSMFYPTHDSHHPLLV